MLPSLVDLFAEEIAMSQRRLLVALTAIAISMPAVGRTQDDAAPIKQRLDRLDVRRGLCLLVGQNAALAVPLATSTELTLFVQSPDAQQVDKLQKQADAAGLLGTRIYVHHDNYQRLHLAE